MATEIVDLPGLGLRLERQSARFSAKWARAVSGIENKFDLSFQWVTIFTEEALNDLHAPFQSGLPGHIKLVKAKRESIEDSIQQLGRLASIKKPAKPLRTEYLRALKQVMLANIGLVDASLYRKEVCFIGIEREGAILATLLGLNPPFNFATPHLKRVKYGTKNGTSLGVAACGLPELGEERECVIVDGAIASGATIMALLLHLKPKKVTIYSAHATAEGIHAIARVASVLGAEVHFYVGFVTDGLDDFYATRDGKLVVGDLGDWIAPLADGFVG